MLATRRIVKAFDFDERRYGNFSDLPAGWRRHSEQGFPLFLEGRLDAEVGHEGVPSFRLELNGGSVAYHYQGLDIAVRPNSDYLIAAWVKTEGLDTARAYVTTCFLDRKGQRLSATTQQSRLLGDAGEGDGWQRLTLQMRCDLPEARYLGISLWMAQEKVWSQRTRPLRAIEREDIEARCWFDDIVVYRMPRVCLRPARSGGVFGSREPVDLEVELSDPDGLNLSGKLALFAADGRRLDEKQVAVQTETGQSSQRILYRDLPVGLYRAELVVFTHQMPLLKQRISFVRVADPINPSPGSGRGFGLILDNLEAAVLDAQRVLLRAVGPDRVKVPVWYAQQAFTGQEEGGIDIDGYVEAVREIQAEPISVLLDDPDSERHTRESGVLSMLDMFTEPASVWKHTIAGIWSRYSGLIRIWQIGEDGQAEVTDDPRIPMLVPKLRTEMAGLMADPLLATNCSVRYTAPLDDKADYHSLYLPSTVTPEDIARHLEPQLAGDPERCWVTVEPLPEMDYPRELRLPDLARRLTETAFAGAGAVFMKAPWDVSVQPLIGQVDPREDWMVFRTVAGLLGGAKPVSRMTLDGQVRCLVFDQNGLAVVCVWDDHAGPEGNEHRLVLGDAVHVVDIWGQRHTLPTAGRCQIVRIGPRPIFLVDCLTWLLEFRRQFAVEPSMLEASFDQLQLAIAFTNTTSEPVSGFVKLTLPSGWDVRPNRFSFALDPGQSFRDKVNVRYPLNAQAQVVPLVGEFTIDGNRRYVFTTPAWFDFGIEDLDVNVAAYRHGEQVSVRLALSNRTNQTLHFESYLIAPDRQRQERLFSHFGPGQNMVRTFVLDRAADLSGRQVRVSLKEVQGSRFWNRVLTIP